MITLDQLKSIYTDAEAATLYAYLGNKHRGGINNSKGNTFENFFTVYQVAKLFNDGANKENTFFSSQVFSFIDDLVIESAHEHRCKFFQIKDVQNLNWTTGNHPIQDDFEMQQNICVQNRQEAELFMVVSRKDVYDDLIDNIQEKINSFTKVIHFGTAGSINSLIRTNNEFKDELVQMCAISNPSSDTLDALGTIVLGAWDATDKAKVSIADLLNKCYNENPNYIKGFENRVSENLKRVLESINGFTFTVEHGYLVWRYLNSDKGILQYAIGTKGFVQWENDVANLGANVTFEILEPFLS